MRFASNGCSESTSHRILKLHAACNMGHLHTKKTHLSSERQSLSSHCRHSLCLSCCVKSFLGTTPRGCHLCQGIVFAIGYVALEASIQEISEQCCPSTGSQLFPNIYSPSHHATSSPGTLVISCVHFVHHVIQRITALCDAGHEHAQRGVVDVLQGMSRFLSVKCRL